MYNQSGRTAKPIVPEMHPKTNTAADKELLLEKSGSQPLTEGSRKSLARSVLGALMSWPPLDPY